MSTIRPLATIAVLAVIGVFLAYQINKGPAVAMQDDWLQDDLIETDQPPAWDASTATAPAAVAVPAGDSSLEARTAPSWAEAPAESDADPASSFPSLPDLPPAVSEPAPGSATPPPVEGQPFGTELANEPSPAPAFPATTGGPLATPADVPQANYGDRVPAGISGSVPSLGASTRAASPFDSAAAAPAAPGFGAAWEAVQTALQRDELTRAHRMLSQWRTEPGLSPNEQQRVETLLGQLAGSVVYSTEHRLEPPHVVAPGETLTRIAQQYNIPWQLLAKINGIAAADAVEPGQSLKVLRGPFQAEVDLARGELVVLLEDRYAGKFPVRVEGTAPADGVWSVEQKRLDETRRPTVGAVVATGAGVEPAVVFANAAGQRVELSASTTPATGANGRLSVASNDLADLYDILSVGSSVTVRR